MNISQQIVEVRAIVRSGQLVVLSKQHPMELPGGVLPFGDEPVAFIKRFLQQHLGFSPEVVQLLEVRSDVSELRQVVGIIYQVKVSAGDVGRDSLEFIWQNVTMLRPTDASNTTALLLNLQQVEDEARQQQSEKRSIDVSKTAIHPKEVIIHTDGGSRGNPGPSAAAYVMLDMEERPICQEGAYVGITTNNQAEYQAVKLALEKAATMGIKVVKFRMDSLLIVNQMLGLYQIKNRDLWPIYANIKELMKRFDAVTFQHVRREFNREADALVNKTLDERA